MPLGWHISVFRQIGDRTAPPTAIVEAGTRIAVWQTGLGGLRWIDELAEAGRGHFLGGNGYPCRYTALARDLLPTIIAGPPGAQNPWVHDPGDILGPQWVGRTVIDKQMAENCAPEEWLLVEAWDES
jgi:hypothetical protein